jgi:hypothetical protein
MVRIGLLPKLAPDESVVKPRTRIGIVIILRK